MSGHSATGGALEAGEEVNAVLWQHDVLQAGALDLVAAQDPTAPGEAFHFEPLVQLALALIFISPLILGEKREGRGANAADNIAGCGSGEEGEDAAVREESEEAIVGHDV